MKRIITISALILVLLLVAGLTERKSGNSTGAIGSIVSVPLSPFQTLIAYFEDGIKSRFSYFADSAALSAENEALKEKISEYQRLQDENDTLRFQNTELRALLNLQDRYRGLKMLGVNIIAWDTGNWFSLFTIDRGTADGIRIDNSQLFTHYDTVITAAGLVGRVVQTTLTTSKVQSVISTDSIVSGLLTRSRQYVEIKGNLIYRDQGLCVIENIDNEIDMSVGDTVETSGVGGNFPKGIIIGHIKEILTDPATQTKMAVVQPAVDFKKLENVFVLVNQNDQ